MEATEHAVRTLSEEEADEHFVIVLSDANFDRCARQNSVMQSARNTNRILHAHSFFVRYGIRPQRFAQVLTSNEDVNAYVIFIGSLGDQAHRFDPFQSFLKE